MRGLVVPEMEEDFTADPVELYFDLAFVFAFAQLVSFLHAEHSLEGVARAALLFLMVWLPWTQFTWSANAISSSARVVRFLFLVATVATMPMSASVKAAYGDGGLLFALSMAIIFMMALAAMISGLPNTSSVRESALRYAAPVTVAVLIFAAGGLFTGTTRIVVWLIGVAVMIYSTTSAGGSEWMVRPGHFAERHGLILIIALGEVIVAIGLPVAETLLEGETIGTPTLVALVLAGVFAGLLWWSYFDRVQPALEHRAEDLEGGQRGRFARDAYTYAHMPIVAGIILTAVGLEDAALHPDEPLSLAFRMIMFAGITLFIGGISIAAYRAFGVYPFERMLAVAVLAVFFLLAGSLHAVWVIVIVDIVGIAGLLAEHFRIEIHPSDSVIHHEHAD